MCNCIDHRTGLEKYCDDLALLVEQRLEELETFDLSLQIARDRDAVHAKVKTWLCIDALGSLAEQWRTVDALWPDSIPGEKFNTHRVRLFSVRRRALDKLAEFKGGE